MTHLTAMTATHALDRITDWQTALRAENKAPGTVAIYADGATRYLRWCAECDHLPMSRAALNSWTAGLLEAGAAPGTARIRQLAVRRFASWLTAGGEIRTDPFPGVKAPRVDPPLVEPLTDDELRALIATCAVSVTDPLAGDTLHHRRDEAIIRLMFETAIRSGEVIDLQLDDLDLIGRLITIRRGKGGRGRIIPVGPATIEALLVYLHEREQHPLADTPDLWLGSRGHQFGREGLSRGLRRRAVRAGVKGFRPHRLRHTAAHRWLAKGGSESGLMAMAGWTRTDMLVRYTRATAAERAVTEARRLDLGTLFQGGWPIGRARPRYYLRMNADNKGEVSLPVEQADLAAEVFRMLADSTRVRLLWALLDKELSVNELANLVGKPAPSVSQHLAKLRMARLVHTRREGTQVFYKVENEHVARLVRDAVFNAEHAGPDVPKHHQEQATPLRSARQRGAT